MRWIPKWWPLVWRSHLEEAESGYLHNITVVLDERDAARAEVARLEAEVKDIAASAWIEGLHTGAKRDDIDIAEVESAWVLSKTLARLKESRSAKRVEASDAE